MSDEQDADAVLPGALASDPKLIQLRPEFRDQMGHVLAELELQGFQPKIHGAYRSAAKQREKFRKGYSKVATPGRHNWGLAADVIDRRWGWPQSDSSPELWDNAARFFMALRDACDKYGVACGGWWFGRRHADGSKATAEHPTHRSVWNRWKLGWDTAHCQMIGATEEWMVEYGPRHWERV